MIGFPGKAYGRVRGAMPTEFSFVVLATAGLAITGWLGAGSQLLGGRSFAETLSGPGVTALGAWMVSGTLVSLALPVLALAIWGRREGVSRALLPYVLSCSSPRYSSKWFSPRSSSRTS